MAYHNWRLTNKKEKMSGFEKSLFRVNWTVLHEVIEVLNGSRIQWTPCISTGKAATQACENYLFNSVEESNRLRSKFKVWITQSDFWGS